MNQHILAYTVIAQIIIAATFYYFGYQLAASALLALVVLDILVHTYKAIQQSFTPKMRLVEITTKGGEVKYKVYIKETLLGGWYYNNSHTNKQWCIETGQTELIRVLEAAIVKEKQKVVTTKVVPIDTPHN